MGPPKTALDGQQQKKPLMKRIILSTRVFSSKPAISIEFNNVDSDNLAGYEGRTRVLYMFPKNVDKENILK